MVKFYSVDNVHKFYRKDFNSEVDLPVKEYKYLYKITKNNVQYILNISTQELAIFKNITLEKIIENINKGNLKHKYELLRHNFIIFDNEDSLERSKELTDKWQIKTSYNLENNYIISYLIFTTTDCNARCFYCYEKGCNKEPMSLGTAAALIEYMKKHYRPGSQLRLSWFGGEPLYNSEVIDYIISELQKAEIPYTSKMISNGYLLDEKTINKARNLWKIRSIQITLDGTEQVYNKTKNYIYENGNPFEIIVNNIKNAVKAGIKIRIRFNVDLANIDDLLQLTKDLTAVWDEDTRHALSGYAHLLFQLEENKADYTNEFIEKYHQLENNISELFYLSGSGRSNKIKLQKSCMTVNQHQVGVLPNGNLCSCEHFTEEPSWGSIFNDDIKPETVVKKWAEISHIQCEECTSCLYYPMCYFLAHCPASRQLCNPLYMDIKKNSLDYTINKLIKKYKSSVKAAETIKEELKKLE